jgi:hypothetical protein
MSCKHPLRPLFVPARPPVNQPNKCFRRSATDRAFQPVNFRKHVTPLVKRVLIFEAIYAAIAGALVLATLVGIPSQGEGNLAAWILVFLAAPAVLIFNGVGLSMEAVWSTFAGRACHLSIYLRKIFL